MHVLCVYNCDLLVLCHYMYISQCISNVFNCYACCDSVIFVQCLEKFRKL